MVWSVGHGQEGEERFASNYMPDYCDNAGQMVRRIVPIWFRNFIANPDPTLLDRILKTELPALIARFAKSYLAAALEHKSVDFWKWCPETLRSAQKEIGVATSYVRRFLALTDLDDDTEIYTKRVPEIDTSILTLQAAFCEYMRFAHPGIKTDEKINKATLQALAYEIKPQVQVCVRCGRHAKKCCSSYSSKDRVKRDVVIGLTIINKK